MKLSKNMKTAVDKFEKMKSYSLKEAVDLLKVMKYSKFDESVDLAINLNVDESGFLNALIASSVITPTHSG